jgi:uncharacterized damage-inducible protein DinB
MNKKHLTATWDHLRQANGIAMRLVAAVPSDKLESHPITKMRSPKELLVHLYGMVIRATAEGALSGEIKELDEPAICARIKTRDELVAYCRECWNAADKAVAQIGDTHLAGMVKTPWGMDFPGAFALDVVRDEFFHHRGQLYAFLRQLGQDVPMMWDFEHNAPEYQPKAKATV